MSYVKTKSKQKPFRVSAFKKIDEKISFALPKYGSSRFVFRFFSSLGCSRLRNSFCPPAHSESHEAGRGQNSVRAISRIHRQLAEEVGVEPTNGFLSRYRLATCCPTIRR